MSVKLRQRASGNKVVLYLDIYIKGFRKTEYLKDLYLFPKSEKGRLTREQNEHNKSTLEIGEEVRYQRETDIRNSNYNVKDFKKGDIGFMAYFEKLTNLKNESDGNYGNWLSTKLHLEAYGAAKILLSDIDKDWLQGFKRYLQKEAKTKSNKSLSINTQASYFSKVKAALKQAFKEDLIRTNVSDTVEHIKPEETERNFLSLEELRAAANVECSIPVLKAAFIFSCLTGLRWGDIVNLTWSEISHSEDGGYVIRFRIRKTKAFENHFIPKQAYELLGPKGSPTDKVFTALKYSAWNNLKLQQWIMKAGISKTITFHCARHTYATLQISLGTDVYTLQSMLGHKSIRNTQVYAKIMDKNKQQAANRLNIEL